VSPLILKRASASRPSGEWNEDDFDVLADGAVVGRIFKANATPAGMSWMWTLAFGHREDRSPTHGYAETREGCNESVREELAGVTMPMAGVSVQKMQSTAALTSE
jgi:hypothetical protein